MVNGRKIQQLWRHFFTLLSGFCFVFLYSISVSYSQNTGAFQPDAGSLLQGIERNKLNPQLPDVKSPEALPQIHLLKGNGENLVLKRVLFEGNLAVKTPDLEHVAAPYLDHPLYFADLQNLAAQISLLYRQRGYVATVSIPHQIVVRGNVRLKIVEAHFSGADIDPRSNGLIKNEFIVHRIEQALKPGELVDLQKLDRALLLLNDLPGASMTGGLDSGHKEGESRYVVVSQRRNQVTATASVDNYGARSTGEQRFNGDISLNNAVGIGDLLTVSALHTFGSDYGRFAVSFPVLDNGLRFEASASVMKYHLTAPELKSGNFAGQSQTYGFDLTYPIVRSRVFNLNFLTGYVGKTFINTANQNVSSHYRTDAMSVGLNANLYDDIYMTAVNSFSLTAVTGLVDLNGSPNKASDSLTTQTQNQFSKIKATVARTQTLSEQLEAVVSTTGQYAFKNLDSSEKLFVGGVSGVRAYPSSEGGGSSAVIGNGELKYKLPYDLTVSGFYDIGAVTQNMNNHYSGALTNNHLLYRGYGLNLLWQGPYQSQYKFTWAHRQSDNPNPNPASGRDQDGTKKLDRYWLSVSGGF